MAPRSIFVGAVIMLVACRLDAEPPELWDLEEARARAKQAEQRREAKRQRRGKTPRTKPAGPRPAENEGPALSMPAPPVPPTPDTDGCVGPTDAKAYAAQWEAWSRRAEAIDAQQRGWQPVTDYRWISPDEKLSDIRAVRHDRLVDDNGVHWLFVQTRPTGCWSGQLERYYADARGDLFELDWRISCRQTRRLRVCGTHARGGCGVAPGPEEWGFARVGRRALKLPAPHRVIYDVETCYQLVWDAEGDPPP